MEVDRIVWENVRIPESCKGVDIVIGIDEAGRGPVLGPLVYAAAFWPLSEDAEIQKMGFNDSKQLKEGDRDGFFSSIRNHPSIGWDMLRANPISLNALSYDAVVRILRRIVAETPVAPQVTDIYIDTVGDPETYRSRLVANLGEDYGRFTIEKKADAKYKVVGAASIVAKVHRDITLKQWRWQEPTVSLDKSFGSGYPGDEHCVKWLASAQYPVFGFPSLIRFSWSTTREALEKGGACAVKWECEEDENAAGSVNIMEFFPGANSSGSKRAKRSGYFAHKKMKHVGIEDLLSPV